MLRQEIIPYVDGNGLVAPFRCDPDQRASDNGPLFSSEYYILLDYNNEITPIDVLEFSERIGACFLEPGLLSRAPKDLGQEAPDDYIGVLAACKVLKNTNIPEQIIEYGWKHKGVFNNASPNTFRWDAFHIRQPHLIAAAYAAANRNPLWIFPLFFYTAFVIAISCAFLDKNKSSERILGWLLIQIVRDRSWLCKLASKLWYRRLYKVYGQDGIKEVAKIYFESGHPFIKYWREAQ